MTLDTVIFDMDGLLIDSEPLWHEAADEVFEKYGFKLTPSLYATTTGLRSIEFVQWWFAYFKINLNEAVAANDEIVKLVISKVISKGKVLPGVEHIFNFFIERNFKIGLATSSNDALIDVVVEKLGIRNYIQAMTSAELLPFGKPHPEVYLNCAAQLKSNPVNCICFEDSFNGLIAAKAARMKCVVVPALQDLKNEKFNAADLKISSLQNFNELLLQTL